MEQACGENFPVAMRVLSRVHRRRLLAVYGFARLADELGDELDRRPSGGARLAGGRTRPRIRRQRPPPAARGLQQTLARMRAAARGIRALDRRQPAGPAQPRAMRAGSSCRPTARCRPTRSASWSWASSSWQAPSGSSSQTACVPPCSWWSTFRISARTCVAAATTCRRRIWPASTARTSSSRSCARRALVIWI